MRLTVSSWKVCALEIQTRRRRQSQTDEGNETPKLKDVVRKSYQFRDFNRTLKLIRDLDVLIQDGALDEVSERTSS